MRPYHYEHRKGVQRITWARFEALCRTLTEELAREPLEIIIGNARAGLFPATALACALGCELFPVRLTRRRNEDVVQPHPVWKVDVMTVVAGRDVVVVDEIADTGETLALLKQRCLELGARHVRTACLVAHSWSDPPPDAVALVSDALVIFPWNTLAYRDGEWIQPPEISQALAAQSKHSPNG